MSVCKYCGREHKGISLGMVIIPNCVTQLISELRAEIAGHETAKVEAYKRGLDMAVFLAKDSLVEAPTPAQDELLTGIVNTITDFKNRATIANVLNG